MRTIIIMGLAVHLTSTQPTDRRPRVYRAFAIVPPRIGMAYESTDERRAVGKLCEMCLKRELERVYPQ